MLNPIKNQGPAMTTKKHYPQRELGKRLSAALEERGISRAEAARRLGVTRAGITDMCKTGRMGKHRLLEVARITGKPIEYFLVALRAIVLAVAIGAIIQPHDARAAFLHKKDYRSPLFAKSLTNLYIIFSRALRVLWRTVFSPVPS